MEKTTSPRTIDGFSAKIKPLSEGMWEYGKDSNNGCLISEASLKEMLFYLSNTTFSIMSPILPEEPISHNVDRLASFRASAQDAKIPLYHIVGRWHGEGNDTYTIDKGYILIKPERFTKERFIDFLQQAIQTYDQYSFVFKSPGEEVICKDVKGNTIQKFSGSFSIDLLAKAYSFRLPMNKSFTLVGAEIPNGSISSFRTFNGHKVQYYLPQDFFNKKSKIH